MKYENCEFLVMPLGLRNAPTTFQDLINEFFEDIIDAYVFVYLDDILFLRNLRRKQFRSLRDVPERLLDN